MNDLIDRAKSSPISQEQMDLVMRRAREKLAVQVGAVATGAVSGASPAGAPTEAGADETPMLRAALAREAEARSVRSAANLGVLENAAIGAAVTFGALALFGPVGFVITAVGGHVFHKNRRKR